MGLFSSRPRRFNVCASTNLYCIGGPQRSFSVFARFAIPHITEGQGRLVSFVEEGDNIFYMIKKIIVTVHESIKEKNI